MATILIVDDEERLRKLLAQTLNLEGFEVQEAATCKAALKKLDQQEPDAVLCDVKLPDGSGVDLVRSIKSYHPLVEVVLLTAYGNIADGVQAIKNGAFDYITKGDDNTRILPLMYRATEKSQASRRVMAIEAQAGTSTFDTFIGRSRSLLDAIELGKKVANTDATVLLLGETGTGKEVMARAIHVASCRHAKSFVAINCSAISKDLLESELFGHLAGAFSGAIRDKQGLFQVAHQGTLFLDEMGEMPGDLQAKLLRVLENGEFFRVGDTKPSHVDVRVIAATNRDLKKESENGRFRSDLYYRLSGFGIRLPALRDRSEDIEALARGFISVFSARMKKEVATIDPAFFAALVQHEWPGNIRELKNAMERSVILMDMNSLTIADLPVELQVTTGTGPHQLSGFSLASAEQLQIRKVLHHTGGNKTEAARLLGIGLTTLYRKIEEYHIA